MTQNEYELFLKESLDKIKKYYNNEQLTFFLGAGVSKDSNLPNWNELIEELKNKLGIKENDFLKIAQLYYMKFGENAYYEKLNEIFDLKSKIPNDLIDNIVDLNLNTLITTNWDDLIEKSIINKGKFYDVIKDDNDFSKLGIGNKVLLKIHGDLNERNIVFKESDYLEYSDNKPLLETYIKSIFIRNIVVFIGYSVSDFNIKQIISWVQKRRTNNLPIYFVKINSEFNYSEFEYFKEKNIYLLYEKTAKDFIDRISQTDNNISTKEAFINILYNLFLSFKNSKYISGYEIIKLIKRIPDFSNLYINMQNKGYLKIHDSRLVELIKKINKIDLKNNKKLQFIIEIFEKSNILVLIDGSDKRIYKFKDKDLLDYNIYHFQKDNLVSALNDSSDLLKKAFYTYKQRKYILADNELKKVSIESLKKKDYYTYIISEYNRINIYWQKGYELHNDRWIELPKQEKDLIKIFDQIPKDYKIRLQFLYNIENNFNKQIIKSYSELIDLQDNGKNRFDNKIISIYNLTIDFILNECNNCLMIEHLSCDFYKNVFDFVLYTYYFNKINVINYIFIYCGIIGYKDFKAVQKKLNSIKKDEKLLMLSENETETFEKVFKNLFNSYKEESENTIYSNYFRKYLIIIINSEVSNDFIELISNSFEEVFSYKDFSFDDYDVWDKFISKYSTKIKGEILISILNKFLDKFIFNRYSFVDFHYIGRLHFIDIAIEKIREEKLDFNYKKIISFIENINCNINIRYYDKFIIYNYFVLPFYKLDNKETKEFIKCNLIKFKEELLLNCNKTHDSETTKMNVEYFIFALSLNCFGINGLKKDDVNKFLDEVIKYQGWNSLFPIIYSLINSSKFNKTLQPEITKIKERIELLNNKL